MQELGKKNILEKLEEVFLHNFFIAHDDKKSSVKGDLQKTRQKR